MFDGGVVLSLSTHWRLRHDINVSKPPVVGAKRARTIGSF